MSLARIAFFQPLEALAAALDERAQVGAEGLRNGQVVLLERATALPRAGHPDEADFVAILQATIAPEFQGRVFTLMMSLATAATPAGLLMATPVADLAGVRAWYVAAGIVCAAMAVVLARPIVRIEESAPAAQPSEASPTP